MARGFSLILVLILCSWENTDCSKHYVTHRFPSKSCRVKGFKHTRFCHYVQRRSGSPHAAPCVNLTSELVYFSLSLHFFVFRSPLDLIWCTLISRVHSPFLCLSIIIYQTWSKVNCLWYFCKEAKTLNIMLGLCSPRLVCPVKDTGSVLGQNKHTVILYNKIAFVNIRQWATCLHSSYC